MQAGLAGEGRADRQNAALFAQNDQRVVVDFSHKRGEPGIGLPQSHFLQDLLADVGKRRHEPVCAQSHHRARDHGRHTAPSAIGQLGNDPVSIAYWTGVPLETLAHIAQFGGVLLRREEEIFHLAGRRKRKEMLHRIRIDHPYLAMRIEFQ